MSDRFQISFRFHLHKGFFPANLFPTHIMGNSFGIFDRAFHHHLFRDAAISTALPLGEYFREVTFGQHALLSIFSITCIFNTRLVNRKVNDSSAIFALLAILPSIGSDMPPRWVGPYRHSLHSFIPLLLMLGPAFC